jgi:hypothetical protein
MVSSSSVVRTFAGLLLFTVKSGWSVVEGDAAVKGGISVVVLLLACQTSFGQVAVQQPVVANSSVNTTVSVPDGGTTFLGGTSSAQSGRSQYGPIRSGTSTGLSRQSTSMSASVRIIDLHEMDEAILRSRPIVSDRPRQMTSTVNSRRNNDRTTEPDSFDTVSPTVKVARSEQLALEAEKAGKTGVAKLHWKMAAKYGSKTAEKRLAELNSP